MQGRDNFSVQNIDEIRSLIREKCRADYRKQKVIRAKIRRVGFYISDFSTDPGGFTVTDFDHLIENKLITISNNITAGKIIRKERHILQERNSTTTKNGTDSTDCPKIVKLVPFVRPRLDVLFVALNPPFRSNSNGHYFSGTYSRFYYLLWKSGLICNQVNNLTADEIVFGGNDINYKRSNYGVIDLITDIVESNSNNVRVKQHHVMSLVDMIRNIKPKFVCVIHGKVKDALNRHADHELRAAIGYGLCGVVLKECETYFVVNYFPNGNAITDDIKINIFAELKALL